MIFVTVGTQLPFDRLVGAVDRWAGAAEGREVFAQVGATSLSPRHIEYRPTLSPAECRERLAAASAVVAHAGAGTILNALELGKPLLIMPRLAALGEHRNDHQVATAERFAALEPVTVARDEDALMSALDEYDGLATHSVISPFASPELLRALQGFIASAAPRWTASVRRTVPH